MKKLFSVLSVLLVLSMLLSACSGGNSTATTTASAGTTAAATTAAATTAAAATTTAAAATTTAATTAPNTEPPTAITGFLQEAGQNMPDGFNHADNWFMNTLCQMANVTWAELTVPAYTDTGTKFNLMMAGGTLPDFIHRADRTEMRKYGEQGAFLNVTDYIAKSSLLSSKYGQAQLDAMKAADGNIYVLDTLPINEDFNVIFIRKDLSDAAGVTEIPTDINEFADVMRKVKETFPDSIVYTCRGLDYQQWFMFQPFNCGDSGYGWYWFPEENTYRMVWDSDNIVKAVEFANMMYNEGLMDKEFITNSGEDVNQKRLSQKCFVWAQNRGGIVARMEALIADGQTDARMCAIPCPTDKSIENYSGYTRSPSLYGGHCIAVSAQTKEADAVWRFIEALYSDECYNMMIYGREGVDYKEVNGSKIGIYPSAAETAWRSVYGFAFTYNTGDALTYLTTNAIYSAAALSDEVKADYDKFYKENMANTTASVLGKQNFAPTLFLETAPDDIVNLTNEGNSEQKSLLAQAIMGEISIDEFVAQKDELVKKYAKVTEYYQDALAKIDGKYDLTYNW